MPFNGSGVASPPGADFPAVANTLIESAKFNNIINDIYTCLSTAITRDGQSVVTANLPMAGNRHTGTGAASARTDYARYDQVQNGSPLLIGTIAGTNTITGVLTPTLTAYTTGQTFRFLPANTNTGATTINIDSLGAKNIFSGNAVLTGGEIQAAVPCEVMYDGVVFQINGPFTIPRSTWTPAITINASATGITYTRQTGRYVKVGPLVFVEGNIILSSKGVSVGNVVLTGLPFAAVTNASGSQEDMLPVGSHLNVTATGGQSMNFAVASASTVASLFLMTDTSTINVADTNLTNTTEIRFSGCYQAAA